MPIIVCGLSHKTAPIADREKVIFESDKIPLYLRDLINNEGMSDAVLLSTCNRTELYCEASTVEQAIEWFCQQHALEKKKIQSLLYCYTDQAAIEHIMHVACGLDSLVLGEPEILGQMKQAYSESSAAGSIGTLFHRLFQQVFAVAKEVRSTTSIGACPVSVASTAIALMKDVFPSFEKANMLVIGAGHTSELLLNHLVAHRIHKIIIVNRDYEKAKVFAKKYQIQVSPFQELEKLLNKVDVVFSATSSSQPIITFDMIQNRKNPLWLIDLAVPRDVEESVRTLSQINLYSIDDLKVIIQKHMRGREHASEKAHQIIRDKCIEFMNWISSIDKVAVTIRAYRKQIEDLCQLQLSKALFQLEQGKDPAQVLKLFTHNLTNKLMHNPSIQLRQACVEGRVDLIELAKHLFAIPLLETE